MKTKLVTYNGETKTLNEWAQQKGINRETIDTRLHRGLSIDDALETPTTKPFSKNDAEMMLNETKLDDLPKPMKVLAVKDGTSTTRLGTHLRNKHRVEFDKWFDKTYR